MLSFVKGMIMKLKLSKMKKGKREKKESCVFCNERKKFLLIGSADKPGPDSKYDLNEIQTSQLVIPVSSAQ